MTYTLPESVLAMAEFAPVEDLLLDVMRERIPDISFQSLVEDNQTFPFVLIRANPGSQWWGGDDRFIDSAMVNFEVFVAGTNGDEEAAILSEAVRVALRDAYRENHRIPKKGAVVSVRMQIRPHRAPDWANSVGPVQYADLPAGVTRYSSTYGIDIRRPRVRPYAP